MGGKKTYNIVVLLLCIPTAIYLNACRHRVSLESSSISKTGKGVYHVVEKHQTFYRICKTYGVDLKRVSALNRISDPGKIQTGQRIFIPGAKRVLKVEIYLDDVAAESSEKTESSYHKLDFIWPLEGKISNSFEESDEKRHQGIDIPAPSGTPIKASYGGMVIYSNHKIKGYGNLVILRHTNEYVTIYAHNQENLVAEGETVEKGQVVARVGQTGRATGPHLHFEIRRNNKAVNPMIFLK